MYARLQNLMQWRMSLLLAGRHDDLAREYLYPLPVYLGGRQQVLRDTAEMEQSLRRLQSIASAMGITRMEARVRAIELPRQGRFRVWVSHRDLGPGEEVKNAGQFVHYCRLTEHGIKTEMSDYPDCRGDWISTEPRRALA
jgi:hypothetical protein